MDLAITVNSLKIHGFFKKGKTYATNKDPKDLKKRSDACLVFKKQNYNH